MKEPYAGAMEEIDADLRDKGVAIPWRPIAAMVELADRFSELKGILMKGLLEPGSDAAEVAESVNEWYTRKYGERLKVSLGPGSYPIILNGEAWEAVFPRIYGRCNLMIDTDLEVSKSQDQNGFNINLLSTIRHLSQQAADSLTSRDFERLIADYVFALNVLQTLQSASSSDLMSAGLADYASAVELLFSDKPNYGNCKWMALQFAEKIMKERIVQLGGSFSKAGHSLANLAKNLISLGIPVHERDLSKIQCVAGVRYGEINVSRKEAILAIRAAVKLAGEVFPPNAFD